MPNDKRREILIEVLNEGIKGSLKPNEYAMGKIREAETQLDGLDLTYDELKDIIIKYISISKEERLGNVVDAIIEARQRKREGGAV